MLVDVLSEIFPQKKLVGVLVWSTIAIVDIASSELKIPSTIPR
jgi:hypothetical protein